MPLDPIFLDYMKDRAQLLVRSSVAQYGKLVYADPVAMTGYWVDGDTTTDSGDTNRNGTFYAAAPSQWDEPQTHVPTTDDAMVLPNGLQVSLMQVKTYREGGDVYGLELIY